MSATGESIKRFFRAVGAVVGALLDGPEHPLAMQRRLRREAAEQGLVRVVATTRSGEVVFDEYADPHAADIIKGAIEEKSSRSWIAVGKRAFLNIDWVASITVEDLS